MLSRSPRNSARAAAAARSLKGASRLIGEHFRYPNLRILDWRRGETGRNAAAPAAGNFAGARAISRCSGLTRLGGTI
jgi:hypothetical protein